MTVTILKIIQNGAITILIVLTMKTRLTAKIISWTYFYALEQPLKQFYRIKYVYSYSYKPQNRIENFFRTFCYSFRFVMESKTAQTVQTRPLWAAKVKFATVSNVKTVTVSLTSWPVIMKMTAGTPRMKVSTLAALLIGINAN